MCSSAYFQVTGEGYHIVLLLFADGVLSWLQNILAFSVMSMVTSLTYAVASASKRIFIIAMSLLILGNPVTGTNIFGMALAIFGVLLYNKVLKHLLPERCYINETFFLF